MVHNLFLIHRQEQEGSCAGLSPGDLGTFFTEVKVKAKKGNEEPHAWES